MNRESVRKTERGSEKGKKTDTAQKFLQMVHRKEEK